MRASHPPALLIGEVAFVSHLRFVSRARSCSPVLCVLAVAASSFLSSIAFASASDPSLASSLPSGKTAAEPASPKQAREGADDSIPALQPSVRWSAELSQLSPDRPRAYFELAEAVLDSDSSSSALRLARELATLSIDLNRSSSAPDGALVPSACLLLADIADSESERRWLRALAASNDRSNTQHITGDGTMQSLREPAALEVATLLSLMRTGEGRRGQRLLAQLNVSQTLERYDRALSPTGIGGADRVRRTIESYPQCTVCKNRRTIREGGTQVLCPSCGGSPGPTLSSDELLAHLRTEAMLLAGTQRSWAGQVIADAASPLRELDLAELPATYGVDAARPLWRSGTWVADPTQRLPKPAPGTGTNPPPASQPQSSQPQSSQPASNATSRSGVNPAQPAMQP